MRLSIRVSCADIHLSFTRKATLRSAFGASTTWRKALADLGIQCKYSPIRDPQSNPTERVMREFAIREALMAESAGGFEYRLQVHPYPSIVKQSCIARYARARNSRALHVAKRWPIWLSSAGTPLSATRKATLRCALFASITWRKALAD
jgi:hypothetical protein